MAREDRITFDAGKDLMRMIEQRSKQEGITVSEYIREAILLEMAFSGDLEATKFILAKIGRRVRDAMIDKLARADIKSTVEALATD
jgi:hypothetical protein